MRWCLCYGSIWTGVTRCRKMVAPSYKVSQPPFNSSSRFIVHVRQMISKCTSIFIFQSPRRAISNFSRLARPSSTPPLNTDTFCAASRGPPETSRLPSSSLLRLRRVNSFSSSTKGRISFSSRSCGNGECGSAGIVSAYGKGKVGFVFTSSIARLLY